ncbi:MAG: ribonuclease P protein component, partial [Pseudobdellovibrionaceae bacterium]|nr:ribonuclease P protein component [Pseudobdellovibrionaceae bacterium]
DAGTKVVTPHLVLIGRRNDETLSKIGFIVSKKVGSAVIRNLVKRRLREIFRTRLHKPEGIDIVVIARGLAAEADFDEVARSFHSALDRLQNRLQQRPGSGGKTISPIQPLS